MCFQEINDSTKVKRITFRFKPKRHMYTHKMLRPVTSPADPSVSGWGSQSALITLWVSEPAASQSSESRPHGWYDTRVMPELCLRLGRGERAGSDGKLWLMAWCLFCHRLVTLRIKCATASSEFCFAVLNSLKPFEGRRMKKTALRGWTFPPRDAVAPPVNDLWCSTRFGRCFWGLPMWFFKRVRKEDVCFVFLLSLKGPLWSRPLCVAGVFISRRVLLRTGVCVVAKQ